MKFYSSTAGVPCQLIIWSHLPRGPNPIEALERSLPKVIAEVRHLFCLDDEIPDEAIQKSIYLLKDDGLVSVIDLKGQHC